MKATYNKIHQVEIEEREFPGMAGETQIRLVIVFPDDNPDQYVNNNTLQFFEQDDREVLVNWLDDIDEINLNSAKSFVI